MGVYLKAEELNANSQRLFLFDFHLSIYIYVSQAFSLYINRVKHCNVL